MLQNIKTKEYQYQIPCSALCFFKFWTIFIVVRTVGRTDKSKAFISLPSSYEMRGYTHFVERYCIFLNSAPILHGLYNTDNTYPTEEALARFCSWKHNMIDERMQFPNVRASSFRCTRCHIVIGNPIYSRNALSWPSNMTVNMLQ